MTKELEYIDKRIRYVENLAKPVEYKIPVAPQPIKVKINHEAAFEEEIQTLNNIKQALLKAEKLEKAWKVDKEKSVDVALIRLCKDSGEYNGEITLQDEWWHRKLLTEEEFELIKEMIE